MVSIRDIGRKARRDLHMAMRVPALFIESTGATPKLIHVRLHTKFKPTEAFAGAQAGMAVMQDMQPKIIFERDELAAQGLELKRNAIVTIEPGEGYRLDNNLAPDDITIASVVTRLSAREMQDMPVPGDSDD